jgi:N-acetylmuramoyl-L-alanine amidase
MRRSGRHLTAPKLVVASTALLVSFAVASSPPPSPRSPLRAPAAAEAITQAGAASGSQNARPTVLTVVTKDGRHSLPLVVISGQPMVALDDLAALFRLTVREEPLTGGLSVSAQGRTLALATSEGLASAGGRLIQLPAPPVRQGRRWFVSVEVIGRALPLILNEPIELRRATGLVLVGEVRVPQVTLRAEGPTRLVVEISPPVAPLIAEEPGRLLIRFDAPVVDLVPARLPSDLVVGAHLGESPGTLVIDLPARDVVVQTTTETTDQATRVTVALATAAVAEGARPTPVAPPAAGEGAPLDTVVIDPGHGGEEVGARGPGGTVEKDVTLSVARRVRSLIEHRLGWRVILTRTADETVDLDRRAAIANNHQADVFLSLHANASVRPSVTGAEVFYLSVEEYGDEARPAGGAAAAELPTVGGGARRLDLILWEMAQVAHLQQSALLAALLEEELRQRVAMSPRAIQPAPFRVLAGANMPAVLVELGFLTNPDEERRLASEEFQNRAAEALVDGLVRFRDRLLASRAPAPRPTGGVR